MEGREEDKGGERQGVGREERKKGETAIGR